MTFSDKQQLKAIVAFKWAPQERFNGLYKAWNLHLEAER